MSSHFWKENWDAARKNLTDWWHGNGPAFCVYAPADTPHDDIAPPSFIPAYVQPCFARQWCTLPTIPPTDDTRPAEEYWWDAAFRFHAAEYLLSRTYFGGDSFPYVDTHIGPGNFAAFLGAQVAYETTTVWFGESMPSLEDAPPLSFDPSNTYWQQQKRLIEIAQRHANGRFLVSMPDLIENVDILASLRGTQNVLMDMALTPEHVIQRVNEITAAHTAVCNEIYPLIQDDYTGNSYSCFHIWGPGRTQKIQCDLSAMFSREMFIQCVAPGLEEQAAQHDYLLYHLDGSQALQHLDVLLGINGINAIQWTPEPGAPSGGDPHWIPLYKRILEGGKSVQIISVKPEQALPLLDALGAKGVFLTVSCDTETRARELLNDLEKYR